MTTIGLYFLRKMTVSFARMLIVDLCDDYFDVESSVEAEVFDDASVGRHVTAGQLAHLYPLVSRARIVTDTQALFVADTETLAWITSDKRIVTLHNSQYRFTRLNDVIRTLNRYECDRLIFRLKRNYNSMLHSFAYETQELRRAAAGM